MTSPSRAARLIVQGHVMLSLLQPRRIQRPLHRLLHASRILSKTLVGPPDPISHLRPVIYDDVLAPPSPSVLYHPYSLAEFDPEPKRSQSQNELYYKLQMQRLDALSQNFWLDSNSRFEAAKEAVLNGLPSSATQLDKERALSEFYKQWLMQERSRLDKYTDSWRKENVACIILSARVQWQKFISVITFSK
ncbi:hypothetical protein D9758_000588 [Tetrapyrgos nigripes]|uniref:COA8 n=1 Tax=Tetrapyrgos nigripes TaxID=182062 RepID=A0A8H5GYT1_9AGAR|nr:hypothetical protein D9758_000588 [Tetrapyrgos nigripes]